MSPQISRRIAGGDIQTATKGDGVMLKIAAHARTTLINIQSGLGGAGKMVAKSNGRLHPVADRLNAGPSRYSSAEQIAGCVQEPVHFAVSEGEQMHRNIERPA